MEPVFQIFIQDDEMNKTPIKVTKKTTIAEVQEIYNNQVDSKKDFQTFAFFYKGEQLTKEKTIGEVGIKKKQILSLFDLHDNIDAAK